jgi:hypothetical protein
MRGWSTTPRGDRNSGDVHVTPIGDLREHELSLACWCAPLLKKVDGATAFLVVHHAMDGRELVEEHGVN